MIKYDQYLCSLSETSTDTSHEDENGNFVTMTSSTATVVNYDRFLEDYLKSIYSKADKLESVDAFCMLDGQYCLIEFKNGDIDKKQLRYKIVSSVVSIIFKNNIKSDIFRNNSLFILVYNKNSSGGLPPEGYTNHHEEMYLKPSEINVSNSKDIILNHVGNKAQKPIVRFKLEMYTNFLFSKVMTMDKEIFEKYIKDKNITVPKN